MSSAWGGRSGKCRCPESFLLGLTAPSSLRGPEINYAQRGAIYFPPVQDPAGACAPAPGSRIFLRPLARPRRNSRRNPSLKGGIGMNRFPQRSVWRSRIGKSNFGPAESSKESLHSSCGCEWSWRGEARCSAGRVWRAGAGTGGHGAGNGSPVAAVFHSITLRRRQRVELNPQIRAVSGADPRECRTGSPNR